MIRIDDASDPRLSDYRDLTDVALRRVVEPAGGLYIAESAKVIARAHAAGHRARSFLVQEKWLPDVTGLAGDAPVFVVSDEVAEQVTGYAVHRGALAAMHRPAAAPVSDIVAGARLVLVLEDIVDHTNVGAIMRNCAALGADAVLVTPRCADPLYRRSVRVSMGTVFQVPWSRMPDLAEGGAEALKHLGFRIAAFGFRDGAITLDQLSVQRVDKLAIVFGTEGHGLSARSMDLADDVVTIPMRGGVDSLNVASASAVALWELRDR